MIAEVNQLREQELDKIALEIEALSQKSCARHESGINIFFKFGLFLALGLTAAVFYSCSRIIEDPDDDDVGNGGNDLKVTVTNVANVTNSSSQIATVKAEIITDDLPVIQGNGEINVRYTIAQTQYQNNGFALELPATLPTKYLLYPFTSIGATISDKTAKGIFIPYFTAYNSNGNLIGFFYVSSVDFYSDASLFYDDYSYSYAYWAYVDKNVTVKEERTGIIGDENIEYSYKYDYDLKKGWNVVYATITINRNNSTRREVWTITATRKKLSDVNYNWYFERL